MKSRLTIRYVVVLLALWVAAVLVVSCAPNAEDVLLAPGMVIPVEGGAIPTPTPLPGIADLTPEQITAGLPAEIAAAYASANPDNAVKLAQLHGCAGCHSVVPGEVKSGPTWVNLADTAVVRRAGESPALYLYESITDPSAFVVAGFNDGVMPKTFKDTLSAQDIADLIAYIIQTQHK